MGNAESGPYCKANKYRTEHQANFYQDGNMQRGVTEASEDLNDVMQVIVRVLGHAPPQIQLMSQIWLTE
jgi:hypothetical protein